MDRILNGEEISPIEWIKFDNRYESECSNYRTCNSCRHYARVNFVSGHVRDLCELIGIADDNDAAINHRGTCEKWRFRPGTWPTK